MRGGLVEDSAGEGLGQGGLSNDLAAKPTALGGLGDNGTTGSTMESSAVRATNQLRPSTVDPRLRGTVVAEESVPGFGIDQGRAEEPREEDPYGESVLTPVRDDVVDVDPVDDPLGPRARQLDLFERLGTRLGSFLLFAEADIGIIFTDNVLGTPNGNSAYAFEFAPEVRLESDWERHAFEAEFAADRSWFNRFSVEDDKIYAALLRGRHYQHHRVPDEYSGGADLSLSRA